MEPTKDKIHESEKVTLADDNAEVTGFAADETTLPKGYFYSRFFVGSFMAIGFSLWAGTAALYVNTSLSGRRLTVIT